MGALARTSLVVAIAMSFAGACTSFDEEAERNDGGTPDAPIAADASGPDARPFEAPVLLVDKLAEPLSIAMDATSVFYARAADSKLLANGFDGKSERTVSEGVVEAGDIVVDGSRVFWTALGANGGCAGGNRGLFNALKDGTSYKRIYDACSHSIRMTAEATSLVMTTKEKQIWRVAKDGSFGTSNNDALFTTNAPAAIVSNGSALFWTSVTNETISTDDGVKVPRVLASAQANAIDILADGKVLYWLTRTGVVRFDTAAASPSPTMLAADQSGPFRIAADTSALYWTNRSDGSIASVAKTGGAVSKLFTGRGEPAAITVGPSGLAWSELTTGSVFFARRR